MLSRRSLLKAKFKSHQQPIRLPWVRDEIEFVDKCSRCHNCITACPEKIIIKADGDFPEINFNLGECTFCAECLKSCSEDLFSPLDNAPWNLTALITEECLTYKGIVCGVCREQCETEAISFTPKIGSVSQPELAAGKCTGCGACFKPCPTQAIKLSYQNTNDEYCQTNRIKERAS